jgi:TonB family protein
MRLAIISSLVLLPVLAHGQATATAKSNQTITSSAVFQAELTQPVALAAVKGAAATDVAATLSPVNTTGRVLVREYVQTQLAEDLTREAMQRGGTLEYSIKGSEPTEASAPTVTRSARIQLTQQELAASPELTFVTVSGTVDQYGFPRELTVTQSAGKAVDRKALAAVSGFRFKPATIDNQPVAAALTISIQIAKQ